MLDEERIVVVDGSPGLRWRKSSRSSMQGNCVEVAFSGAAVAARDSKDPGGGELVLGAATWAAFLGGIRSGRFDV
ncbi:DUF397 domain-containing protein [Saccharopolyspora indica]|uniref:DUF397 domain-containing protein n=1 Tax=Saccharopolyspora indica TaxID=1229659 RepID=UPI0022EAA34E|nr:DUF397 domain-containing protein [Saccharopolyspora indica]MDA3650185.1 DUF397 domain-containing protein [Saccharopolyspora indica]